MMRYALALVLAVSTASLSAAQLVVMSAGALETGMQQVVEGFERATGHTVRVEIGNAPQLTARLAVGEVADVLVAPAAVVDQAIADGRVVAASRTPVGRVGVGLVVRAGAPSPDISSAGALRRTLLDADAIIYNQGSSGTYIDRLLGELGIAGDIRGKTVRVLNGEAVMERMATAGGTEVAFLAMPDAIRDTGLQYVGPLPASLQNYTRYDGVVMNAASDPAIAADFLRFLTSAAARRTLETTGIN